MQTCHHFNYHLTTLKNREIKRRLALKADRERYLWTGSRLTWFPQAYRPGKVVSWSWHCADILHTESPGALAQNDSDSFLGLFLVGRFVSSRPAAAADELSLTGRWAPRAKTQVRKKKKKQRSTLICPSSNGTGREVFNGLFTTCGLVNINAGLLLVVITRTTCWNSSGHITVKRPVSTVDRRHERGMLAAS